jgi:carbamoyl-phosphate synthase small subunit
MRKATLALADGTIFEGLAFGASGEATGEVVFNTSMTGYQEILTDPSYVGQMVCMTYPEQGNYGTNRADEESPRPHPTGFIVRNFAPEPSSFRAEEGIETYLVRHGIVGIHGVDTRRLTRHIRTTGAQMGVISTDGSGKALADRARSLPGMEGQDLATRISTPEPYSWDECGADAWNDDGRHATENPRFHVVAYDWGLKRAMLRLLAEAGCRITVVPSRTTSAETLALRPDGVFLTNGPGDPAAVVGARETVAALLGKVPVFGICLGHQILSLAIIGASTYKLKFGHRGANQPVKDLATGKVDITAQNHGFAVDDRSLGKRARVSHVNLNDGTVEGIEVLDAAAFGVQYHPESSPGPHDARHLFGRFVGMMEQRR